MNPSITATKARQRAHAIVMRLLKIRLRSEKEIKDRLKQKKIPNGIIDSTIEHFKRLHMIDDRQFAQDWTATRLMKPYGLNRIRFELQTKGIDKETLKEVIGAAYSQNDESLTVESLAKQCYSKYKGLEQTKARQRVMGFLARRGFKYEDIYHAVSKL